MLSRNDVATRELAVIDLVSGCSQLAVDPATALVDRQDFIIDP